MADLVNYSSSSEADEPTTPPAKKRKLSERTAQLPPLPAAFLDQYSSTVRTSAQDDPSLHGGRKRVTPHVAGNWPAHVYLEWHPDATEAKVLAGIVAAAQEPKTTDKKTKHAGAQDKQRDTRDGTVHSLLENDLGVALPLHLSLSRPLTLKTEQKDAFLSRLRKAIIDSNVNVLHAQPKDLGWHSNETSTRWFLVLRLQRPAGEEMSRLLDVCNTIANYFGQPLLYAGKDERGIVHAAPEVADKFHISVAWSLEAPAVQDEGGRRSSAAAREDFGVPYKPSGQLNGLSIAFGEVKVRIGQDVHAVQLKASRRKA